MNVPLRRRGRQARRQPTRRVELPQSLGPQHQRFEALVEEALDGLPPEIERLLENVAIVIDDEPSREQLDDEGLDGDETLYGLYEGVPATAWGAESAAVPNKITLFRLPLEEDFPDPRDLSEEVRRTVVHELAHHAGIDDERLHELDRD
jgi:predicted Zn-dependent protease with MMP-like domain